ARVRSRRLSRGLRALGGRSRAASGPGGPSGRVHPRWRAACFAECPEESRAFLARARELGVEDPVVALELETAELFVEAWIGPITVELLAPRPRVAATARALAAAQGGYERLGVHSRRVCLDALEEQLVGALYQGEDEAIIVACDEITSAARGFDEEVALNAQ